MATVSLRTPEVSLAMKPDANTRLSSVKSLVAHRFINSTRRHHVQKFMFPLTVKSMKISKPAFSTNCSIFQTCNLMSTSTFRGHGVRASDIKNGELSPTPEVGVSVFILKDNKILFGRRCSVSVGDNTYFLPGGHLEFGESHEECAVREVKEETGLDIKNIEPLTTNNIYHDATHINVTYMRAQLSDPNQTPQNIEPDKCEGWEWYDFNNLPEPMFGPLKEMLQDGFNPFPIGF